MRMVVLLLVVVVLVPVAAAVTVVIVVALVVAAVAWQWACVVVRSVVRALRIGTKRCDSVGEAWRARAARERGQPVVPEPQRAPRPNEKNTCALPVDRGGLWWTVPWTVRGPLVFYAWTVVDRSF